jgi:DNA-binding XRE family transcriptional regulator
LVIEAIKNRAEVGSSLGYATVVAEDEALTGAARRYFGSWDAAVKAAGYDISEYKYKLRDERRESWDREKVLRAIQEYALSGGNLSASYVRSHRSKLYSAAVVYCGSWREALESLGINYDEVKLRDEWTPDRVIEEIRKAHENGADLSDLTVNALRGDLYGAAHTHFGSWRGAIEASGLMVEDVRRTREWSREEVAEFVLRCYKSGITLSQMRLAKLIHTSAIYDHFTSTEDLYNQIGIDDGIAGTATVRSNLERIMEEKGVTAKQLAQTINRTDAHIQHLINSKYPPKLIDALRIANALGCNVNDIWYL